ncbi:hypothetical protein OAA_14010 [Vibrio cyclitrophicus 1F175]|nr:hypothetical protein OA9_15670 [Vibrio cyclitrophicus 1F97]OEF34063.1 hypothetical protein OA7_06725 [Vibrio cyclitrophicus 1F53]OEF63514.1 hypothetical protein OAA_14010 [Vibrio cyclitrophicus 1F175]OEF77186.1 hypothetical protein OA5_17595 [Vibrio cyclitrophicus 1F111]PMH36368.1 hypothetical protein BCU72_08650 [Vibrio cyclitrophicus]
MANTGAIEPEIITSSIISVTWFLLINDRWFILFQLLNQLRNDGSSISLCGEQISEVFVEVMGVDMDFEQVV